MRKPIDCFTKWLLDDGWTGWLKFFGAAVVGAILLFWTAALIFFGSCMLLGVLLDLVRGGA